MQSQTPARDEQRLEQLLFSRRQDENHKYMGWIEIFWGIFNILGIWLSVLVFKEILFWAVWIPLGVAGVSLLLGLKLRKATRVVPQSTSLLMIWSFALLCLPVLIVLFPSLGVYSFDNRMIFPLAMIWIGLAFLATSIFLRQKSQYLGAVIFIASAPCFLFFGQFYPWIFTAVSAFGLLVPGILCFREDLAP